MELYKYWPYAPGGSKVSFVAEYAYSFLATVWLTLKARRTGRFAVIQICNPPDIFWPIGMSFARSTARCLCSTITTCAPSSTSPVSLAARSFPTVLRALERRTHRTADHVISTNESYRDSP